MKNAKKLVAVLLAVIMALALAVPAVADNTNPGSITLTGVTPGKTYDLYKIFDLVGKDTSSPADGTYDKVSYTIDSDWVSFFIGTDAPGAAYLVSSGSNLNSLTYSSSVYYINITDSNVADFAQDALDWCGDNTPAADKSETIASSAVSSSAVISDLALGYYLVYPQGATEITGSNASICSLTSTMPAAQVVIKATYPTISKTVDDASVEIGQTVTYTVSGKVPDTTGYTSYTYKVSDTMPEGLTFNSTVDEITVTFGSSAIDVESNPTAGTSYVVSSNGFVLTFDMTKYQTYVGQDITIEYSAVVNENAVVTLTENKATLDYSDDPADSDSIATTESEGVDIYSSKIVIDKYDGADSSKATKLSGAEFVLVKKGTNETFYKYTAATANSSAIVEWVDSIDDATVVTTNSSGSAEFIGLEDGTYYLRETNPPEGFNQLTDDVEVTVAHTTTNDNKAIGVTQTSEIANNSGTVLPATGGMGTVLFITVGAVLFMAAGIVLTTKKRLYNEG